ncbi:MAG: rod shape-determining protein, partial [Ruminococcus sp.]|nr:rod shape-determining protein [Ruminococcus sp.]
MANTDIGIDLGTANIVMTMGSKGVVLSEPAVIAYNTRNERILGVGKQAYEMIGKNPDYIAVVRPVSAGVISDDDLAHSMIREFILKVTGNQLIKPRIIICVPSFITDIESRAVVDAAKSAGAREVYLIQEPIAAMLGAGVNITKAKGHMIVDIGGGTTDVAIVSMNGVVTSHSIKTAGNTIDRSIIKYIQAKYKLLIGERTAERVKIELCNLYDPSDEMTMIVKGRSLLKG